MTVRSHARALVLAACLLLAALLAAAPAQAAEIVDYGTCGDNLTWTLDAEGTLTISGTGEMDDYDLSGPHGSYTSTSPWHTYTTDISSLTLDPGITSIGAFAFYDCTNLTSVVIPENVTSIGSGAFAGCSNLSTVEFLGNAPTVPNVGMVRFPDSATIYYQPSKAGWPSPDIDFRTAMCREGDLSDISSLYANDRNAQGILFTLNDVSNTAIVGDNSRAMNNGGYGGESGHAIIPATVTKDGKSYNVIGIGQNAFSRNPLLKTLEIGAKVSTVEPSAFANCPNFTAFTVNAGSNYYQAADGVLYDKGLHNLYCYPDGKADVFYQVPDTVGVIGPDVFCSNENIREIVVPESVIAIGNAAFGACGNLVKITLPFVGTSADQGTLIDVIRGSSIKTVVITGGTLHAGSFYAPSYYGNSFKNLEEIILPAGLTEIPNECFSGCANLTKLQFGGQAAEAGKFVLSEGIAAIGNGAFSGCKNLTSISIPASVTAIGEYRPSRYPVFNDCTSLEKFTVAADNPNFCSDQWGVLYTKDKAELIAYPTNRAWPYYNVSDHTASIGPSAFYGCVNLKNLYIPNSVSGMVSDYNASIAYCPGMTVCAYLDSEAYRYAANNSINVWPMDNFQLQGIEIYALPEQTTFQKGAEDFTGLYVVANGGKALQVDDYTVSYDPTRSGRQMVQLSYLGETAEFPITLYGAGDAVVDFGPVTLGNGQTAIAAVYDASHRLLQVETDVLTGENAQIVVPKQTRDKMALAKLFVLSKTSLAPAQEAIAR